LSPVHRKVQRAPAEESGAVAIIVALLLVAFLALVALVVDLGGLYDHDRDLQTAADAGALAGAQELIYSQGSIADASAMATDYVNRNAADSNVAADGLVPWSPNVSARSVEVNLREEGVPFFFAPIIGETEGTVTAHAKAEVVYLTSVNHVLPLAIPYMHPERFRVVYRGTGIKYEITNPNHDDNENDDGVYSGGKPLDSLPGPGAYLIDLEALDAESGDPVFTWPGVGLWRVFGEPELITSMEIQRSGDSFSISVETPGSLDLSQLGGRVGGSNFTLTRNMTAYPVGSANAIYQASAITIPTQHIREGWGTVDVTITDRELQLLDERVARFYVSRMPFPIYDFEQTMPAGYGVPEPGDSLSIGAEVTVRVLKFNELTELKVNMNTTGEWSGNEFWADIYSDVSNLSDELGAPGEDPYFPLEIGSRLKSETGRMVGQIDMDHLIGETVIVPIVDPTSFPGQSDTWRIQSFAPFRIDSYTATGQGTEVIGEFVHGLSNGEWQLEPPGGLYVESAVLIE